MDNWTLPFRVDLAEGRGRGPLVLPTVLALSGDNRAHTWVLTLMNGDEAADLAGATAGGYFTREDGNTVYVQGAVDGNVCSYIMAQSCYASPGKLRCVFRITHATLGTITILERIVGIGEPVGGGIIDPGEVIPGPGEVIALYGEMQEATEAANEAAALAMQAQFRVLGIYATLSALQAAHPQGAAGEAYAVGTAASNEIYIWDVNAEAWANIGSIPIDFTETDPTVPSWAKQPTKPSYTAAEVGALSSETDPTVPSWAKAASKPAYNISELTGAIGGINLLVGTSFAKDTTGWTLGTNVTRDTTRKLLGCTSIKSMQSGLGADGYRGMTHASNAYRCPCAVGDIFTGSVYTYIEDYTTFEGSNIGLEIKAYDASGAQVQQTSNLITPTVGNNGKWTRLEKLITITASTAAYVDIVVWVRRNGTAWFACAKLERGNIVTGWSPSWEDLLAVNPSILTLAEDWLTPTLENGWTEVSGYPVRYYKDGTGIVRIKGRLTTGSANRAFAFPAGYRPPVENTYVTQKTNSPGSVARVSIAASGSLFATTLAAGEFVDLTSISFRAEA